jgi:hypothetical protein
MDPHSTGSAADVSSARLDDAARLELTEGATRRVLPYPQSCRKAGPGVGARRDLVRRQDPRAVELEKEAGPQRLGPRDGHLGEIAMRVERARADRTGILFG